MDGHQGWFLSLRPTKSVSSFLFQVIEMIHDQHIHSTFTPNIISRNQKAYVRGKYTEIALDVPQNSLWSMDSVS